MNTNRQLSVAAWFAMLILTLGSCVWCYQASKSAAASAASGTVECDRLSRRIRQQRAIPTRAVVASQNQAELASQVEEAAQQSQIQSPQIIRVDPRPASRIGQTSYKKIETHVEFHNITLKQLIGFLDWLERAPSRLHAENLRLIAPRQPAEPHRREVWRVEVTLTQLIFAPTNPSPLITSLHNP